jgi:hypothetical protein
MDYFDKDEVHNNAEFFLCSLPSMPNKALSFPASMFKFGMDQITDALCT